MASTSERPYFPLPANFDKDVTRAPFPRQLIVYERKTNNWSPCTDELELPGIDYVAISYRQSDFPDKALFEKIVQDACEVLQINAYWLDFACTGRSIEEKNVDLYRIADVFRGAKKTLIMIKGDDNTPQSEGWQSWGDRVWTLPEALLSLVLLCKVGTRRIEEINLRRVANFAYKNRDEEMMLVEGFSGKDPLPLAEKVDLLRTAFWKRSSGPDMKTLQGNSSTKQNSMFTAYPGERVYALMGFMQYRILPNRNDSEEEAFNRLMASNKLENIQFSTVNAITSPSPRPQIAQPQLPRAQTNLLQPTKLPTTLAPIPENTTIPENESSAKLTSSIPSQTQEDKSQPRPPEKKETAKKKGNSSPFSRFKSAFDRSDNDKEKSSKTEGASPVIQHFVTIDSPTLRDVPINTAEQKALFAQMLDRFETIVSEAQLVPSRARDLFRVDQSSKTEIKRNLDKITMLPIPNLSPLEQTYLKLKYETLFRALKDRGPDDEEITLDSTEELSDEILDTIHAIKTLQNITQKSSVGDWVYSLHSVCLASMGLSRYDEGLQLCQWECATWRVLANLSPKEFNSSFIICLTNLTTCFTYLAQDNKALDAVDEAIKIQRTIPSESSFTLSLERRAALLARCGRDEEAVNQMQEVVKLNKAAATDDEGEIQYARSLTSLANAYTDCRQYDEAYNVIKEAIEIQRQLFQKHSDSNDIHFQLASSLLSFTDILLHKTDSDKESALKSCREACDTLRLLVKDDQETYEKHLTSALVLLFQCYSNLHQKDEAVKSIEEAVRIKRTYPLDYPEKDFVYDLEKLCRALYNAHQYQPALEAITEAIQIRRRLFEENNSDSSKKHLVKALEYKSYSLGKLGRADEGSVVEEEISKLRDSS